MSESQKFIDFMGFAVDSAKKPVELAEKLTSILDTLDSISERMETEGISRVWSGAEQLDSARADLRAVTVQLNNKKD